jgi:hypothetical protein
MKSRKMAFAKRDGYFQYVPPGTGVIVSPENSIYLSVNGDGVIPEPKERMTPTELVEWLQGLKKAGFTCAALDGLGYPLKVDPDEK